MIRAYVLCFIENTGKKLDDYNRLPLSGFRGGVETSEALPVTPPNCQHFPAKPKTQTLILLHKRHTPKW